MKFDGYILKDKLDEAKTEASRIRNRIESSNQYFESDGLPTHSPRSMVEEYASVMDKISVLSYLQCWYNTVVTVEWNDNRITLQEAIKEQSTLTALHSVWTSLAVHQAESRPTRAIFGTSSIARDKDFEYPKYIIHKDACLSEADSYSAQMRKLKRVLRVANATTVDTPDDSPRWEQLLG